MLPSEAEALLGQALFLDVREGYEYDAGHIEGSVHIPIGQISARFQELRADQAIIVVCQVGQRSGLVADFLGQRGMEAQNLEGGLQRWAAEGRPLTARDDTGTVVDGWARDLSGGRINPDPDETR
jgi:rhodanese-related sulfurtransferase